MCYINGLVRMHCPKLALVQFDPVARIALPVGRVHVSEMATCSGFLMRRAAQLVGLTWIGAVVVFGLWLGFRQAFLGAPGLIFESGMGDIYVLAAIAAPGGLLVMLASNSKGKTDA